MTDEVAALCLRNNYLQSLALSLAERRGMAEFPDHVELMQSSKRAGCSTARRVPARRRGAGRARRHRHAA